MGTLICTVEMSTDTGITISVEDPEAEMTQTITLNGATIVSEVSGEEGTSTITQTESSVTIQCESFTVEASGPISISSSGASEWTSEDTFSVTSQKDMDLTSEQDVNVTATNIAGSASTSAEITGGGSKLALSASEASLSSPANLTLKGEGQGEMSAGMVKVASKGLMNLESNGLATLKGSLTNIQGSLVTVG